MCQTLLARCMSSTAHMDSFSCPCQHAFETHDRGDTRLVRFACRHAHAMPALQNNPREGGVSKYVYLYIYILILYICFDLYIYLRIYIYIYKYIYSHMLASTACLHLRTFFRACVFRCSHGGLWPVLEWDV